MPQSSAPPPTARRGIAHDPLLDTPLPRLLAEYEVELVDSSITDAAFFGYYLERRDGHRILAMPRGRSACEHDRVARMLLADGLGLDGPPAPEPLELTRA
ncbi:hypothetical protein [Streptomyces sp. BH104]|uniref:hypothetical protein n=1 Tax=Streptomyces sp. BH104 TaxID=3410407 RepID=UPI003BB70F45